MADISAVLLEKGVQDIYWVHSMYEAVDIMLEHSFSSFVIDGQLPVSKDKHKARIAGVDFARFIRMCDGPVSEAAIIFLRSASHALNLFEAEAEIAEAKDGGVDCIVSQPLTIRKFNEVVEPNLAQNRAFVRNESYIGPCRRRDDTVVTKERRANPSAARRRSETAED